MAEPGGPQHLGKYLLRRVLGKGAMGIVYEGYDEKLDRTVAIKTIRSELWDSDDADEMRERFIREARAVAGMSHPNIVTLYEFDEKDGTGFMALEFVAGQTLKAHMAAAPGRRMEPRDAIKVAVRILEGLAYSHRMEVTHRDIKPGNVMLTPDGQVKILDFGVARLASAGITVAGTMLGTPAYMAPEQLLGKGVDHRADLYSVGVVLYEMLTGRKPYEGDVNQIHLQVLQGEVEPPSALVPELTPELDDVVLSALSKDADTRFPDADSFAAALRDTLDEPLSIPTARPAFADPDATVVQGVGEGTWGSRGGTAPGLRTATGLRTGTGTGTGTAPGLRTARGAAPPPEPRKRKGRGGLVAALVLLLLAGGGGAGGWYWWTEIRPQRDGDGESAGTHTASAPAAVPSFANGSGDGGAGDGQSGPSGPSAPSGPGTGESTRSTGSAPGTAPETQAVATADPPDDAPPDPPADPPAEPSAEPSSGTAADPAPPTVPDPRPEPTPTPPPSDPPEQLAALPPDSLRVTTTRGPSPVFAPDETLDVTVRADRPLFTYCFYEMGHGDIVRIFPTQFAKDPMVKPGRDLRLPGDQPFLIRMDTPGETERVACIGAESDLTARVSVLLGGGGLEVLPVDSLDTILATINRAANGRAAAQTLTVRVR
ncbi:serine/threonine-protein kinase [Roseospira navarrensis]|uniref:non-specific serine/threonine protein kinase n=1 Tax=Roseospira navarrensis TaxID=140058 RepID=A0A7X1ZF22_9PROT|nr:serine/threonine-protein kinase [Roseospira navarrensis]MQX37137.1 protein kinase [Roseospira navarrensis]